MDKTAEEIAAEEAEAQRLQDEADEAARLAAEAEEGQGAGETKTAGEGAEEDEVVLTIGEETPTSQEEETAHAPEWVRELRKSHRELSRENRELKAKLQAAPSTAAKPTDPGPKPTLEGCDFDADRYASDLETWHTRRRAADEAEAEARRQRENQDRQWQTQLADYGQKRAALKFKDVEEVEAAATDVLSEVQQGIIVQGAENGALVMYALGKNPTKAKELSSIKDPVKFAFAVAKLEAQLKVTTRKAPPPEQRVAAGSGARASATDNTLAKLREEAQRTGDFSKVIAHRRAAERSRAA